MHIEDQTLQSPVSGVNLAPGSFGDQLSAEHSAEQPDFDQAAQLADGSLCD
jgi:hypothetical protein